MLMATQSPATVVSVTAVMLALDICAVGLRFLTRKKRRQQLQIDDCLCVVSLVLFCGLATTLFIGVAQQAIGYPTPTTISLRPRTSLDISNEKVIIVSRLQYIFLVVSVPTLAAIKASVLFFCRRIFVVDKTNLRNGTNMVYLGMICLTGLWAGGITLSIIFACKGNFAAFWTSARSLIAHCVNTLELMFAFAVSDFVFDVIILVMPIPTIWRLHLTLPAKLGVLFVFLLGTLATVASLIRMVWVIWARTVGFDLSLDQNLLITTFLFWNMLEVSLGIIACCLPTLRGLVDNRSVDSFVGSIRERLSLSSGRLSSKSENSLAS